MPIIYWVKWRSAKYKLFPGSPDSGFAEMQDMFRYSGDMPLRARFKPPEEDSPWGWYYVELMSRSHKYWLEAQTWRRWESFGAMYQFVKLIAGTPALKKYEYDPETTQTLFNKLLKESEDGDYATW